MASMSNEPEKPKPWLLVGLGNPGKRYGGTRHNIGFCCLFQVGCELVDFIAEAEGIAVGGVSFKSSFGKGFIVDFPVMLAKPQTFMNASGESVGAIVSYYKIPLTQVLVVNIQIPKPYFLHCVTDFSIFRFWMTWIYLFGKLRLLPKGGHAGHNGMRSIMSHLKGSQDFPRLRTGIGRPPGKTDPANFVLRPFNREEAEESSLSKMALKQFEFLCKRTSIKRRPL